MKKYINKKHGALRVSRTWCSSMRMTIWHVDESLKKEAHDDIIGFQC